MRLNHVCIASFMSLRMSRVLLLQNESFFHMLQQKVKVLPGLRLKDPKMVLPFHQIPLNINAILSRTCAFEWKFLL